MDFEQFKVLVKAMKSVYTSEKFLPDAEAVKTWYLLLKDIPYKLAEKALLSYMKNNKFPPTVADIRELAVEEVQGGKLLWAEAWHKVLNSARKYGYYEARKGMESLDELTKEAVRCMGGFRVICESDAGSPTERAQFRQIYEQLANREMQKRQEGSITQLIEKQEKEGLTDELKGLLNAGTEHRRDN